MSLPLATKLELLVAAAANRLAQGRAWIVDMIAPEARARRGAPTHTFDQLVLALGRLHMDHVVASTDNRRLRAELEDAEHVRAANVRMGDELAKLRADFEMRGDVLLRGAHVCKELRERLAKAEAENHALASSGRGLVRDLEAAQGSLEKAGDACAALTIERDVLDALLRQHEGRLSVAPDLLPPREAVAHRLIRIAGQLERTAAGCAGYQPAVAAADVRTCAIELCGLEGKVQ